MAVSPQIPEETFRKLRVRLARLRKEKDLSYDRLAAEAGISRRNLVALETGERADESRPAQGTLTTWYRIAAALDVPFSELMKELD